MNILIKSTGLVVSLLFVFICQVGVNLFANELQGKWSRGGIRGTERDSYQLVFAEKSKTNVLTGKWHRGGGSAKLVNIDTASNKTVKTHYRVRGHTPKAEAPSFKIGKRD